MPVRNLTLAALAVTATALIGGCDDHGQRVTSDDIRVVTGPDGTKMFRPVNDTPAASGYAQWLQLRSDLGPLEQTGDFLDTQLANLHLQEILLKRARGNDWHWARLHGEGDVNFDSAIEIVQQQSKRLRDSI
ncbi:MAG: hypothetical protein MK101_10350 [Phycisphaerales bacterium]|nr:hypothetical protein [Phycisphaerales bacterium]